MSLTGLLLIGCVSLAQTESHLKAQATQAAPKSSFVSADAAKKAAALEIEKERQRRAERRRIHARKSSGESANPDRSASSASEPIAAPAWQTNESEGNNNALPMETEGYVDEYVEEQDL